MKRTKERFDRVLPSAQERDSISGCIKFDGEDLCKPIHEFPLVTQVVYMS